MHLAASISQYAKCLEWRSTSEWLSVWEGCCSNTTFLPEVAKSWLQLCPWNLLIQKLDQKGYGYIPCPVQLPQHTPGRPCVGFTGFVCCMPSALIRKSHLEHNVSDGLLGNTNSFRDCEIWRPWPNSKLSHGFLFWNVLPVLFEWVGTHLSSMILDPELFFVLPLLY